MANDSTVDRSIGLLKDGLSKLDLDSDNSLISLLCKYIDEIELFNPAYGLVKVQDRCELVIKHILDSLAPVGIFRRLIETSVLPAMPAVADVGSGAGLPGIPLAMCMPDASFTLIERMGRRAGFLRNTIAVLGLSNVQIEETDMEKLKFNSVNNSGYDLIVFRAFKPLDPIILRDLSRLLKPYPYYICHSSTAFNKKLSIVIS